MDKTKPQRKKDRGLSLKFDPKFRFALEFSARRAGKTLTAYIEDAVTKSFEGTGWEAFWHPSAGVRELLRLRYGGPRSASDDELWLFVTEHDDIFFRDMAPRVHVLDALWPDIRIYLDTWKKTRGTPKADEADKLMRAVIAKLPKGAR